MNMVRINIIGKIKVIYKKLYFGKNWKNECSFGSKIKFGIKVVIWLFLCS